MALRFENDFLKKLEYLHVVSKRALETASDYDEAVHTAYRAALERVVT